MEDGKPVVDSDDSPVEAPAEPVDEQPAGPESVLEDLAAERDQWARERAELLDRLLRRQAEFENFRRRTERERAEFLEFAGSETVQSLLPSWTISSGR